MARLITREERLQMGAEDALRTALSCRCACHSLRMSADWCSNCQPKHTNASGGIRIYRAKPQ